MIKNITKKNEHLIKYIKSIFYSFFILFGLGLISIAPIWISFIGPLWPLPIIKKTNNKYFFLTIFILISMLIIRSFIFSDFIGTMLLIPFLFCSIGIMFSRFFNKKNTIKKELVISLSLGIISLFGILFYLTVILGLFHPFYFKFQIKQILHDTLTEQSNFLKIYLGESSIIDKIETLAFYMSKLLVGILISITLFGITLCWHLSNPKEKRIPITQWKGNCFLMWGLIIGLIFLNLGKLLINTEMTFLGINILIIYGFLLFALGLVAFIDTIKNLSFWILVTTGVLFLLAPQTLIFLLILGFINCFTKKNILKGFNNENNT